DLVSREGPPPPPLGVPIRQPIAPVAAFEPAAEPIAPAAPPPALEWPQEFPRSGSRQAAFQSLLATWGLVYEGGSACEFAQQQGLECLYRRGSLGVLRLLDRPAVLTLVDANREEFHATLVGLSDQLATFFLNGQQIQVPVQELEDRWLGEFTLLWRRPPFQGLLRPGDRGPAIDWLNRQLATVLAQAEPPRGRPLEGATLARLREFQRTRGLDPDGLAGPVTLIHLDSALGGGSPRLAPTGGS
ncbi:MAG: peptidoglycan-binding protein, partial [Desulfuromonadales bacterium]|nr:peptidoglycan-binding protein [Desulfuromonadales bacterium]